MNMVIPIFLLNMRWHRSAVSVLCCCGWIAILNLFMMNYVWIVAVVEILFDDYLPHVLYVCIMIQRLLYLIHVDTDAGPQFHSISVVAVSAWVFPTTVFDICCICLSPCQHLDACLTEHNIYMCVCLCYTFCKYAYFCIHIHNYTYMYIIIYVYVMYICHIMPSNFTKYLNTRLAEGGGTLIASGLELGLQVLEQRRLGRGPWAAAIQLKRSFYWGIYGRNDN